MKRLIIFLTIIIIHLICGLDSDLHFQSKYSSKYNNLRTCIHYSILTVCETSF